MTDFLNGLLMGTFMENMIWVLIAAPVVLAGLTVFLFWFIRTRIFKFRLRRIINAKDDEQSQLAIKRFTEKYTPERLMRYSRRMERYSRQMGPEVVRETGLADKWTKKLSVSSLLTVKDIRRVLLYCPPSSVFKAFIAAGEYTRLRKYFISWMQKEGEEETIRLLAKTCRGEDFDSSFGKSFLENHVPLLRELTGEAEWYSRYFAYKILIQDNETLTVRGMEAGLMDPHPLVRKIITETFSFEREKTWNMLWDKLIHDPVYEVRQAARKRISKDFMDLYSLKDKAINIEETFRVLELLDTNSQEDRSFAMSIMHSDNKELRYPAAVFLEKCGMLAAMLAKNTLDDPANIDQSFRILQEAMEVNVSGFLSGYPSGDGAPLLVVARLLAISNRAHENVCHLVKEVFSFFSTRTPEPSTKEIYIKTLEAVNTNGNIKSFELVAEELIRRENDVLFLEMLLPNLPVKAESIFTPILFRFLRNENLFKGSFVDSCMREYLVQILGHFRADVVLPQVFHILNGNRAEFSHEVRICALKIIAQLRLSFCLQRVLESLPTLRNEEIDEFVPLIADYPKAVFEEKVKTLLASPDARIRASLIRILPVTKNDSFLKEVRSSLKDVDPDVRVAAINALLGFGEIRLLNQETSMLRDPVERVRLATAEVIARHGNSEALEILKTVLNDPNETDIVKIGVISGLGQAVNAEGIPILVSVLESSAEFGSCAAQALANRTAKRDIIKLIEIFKDAQPLLREKMISVFKIQGREAEPWILEILKDDVASLKPYLVKILEETGFIDETKRQLLHRNVEERRKAAALLSLLDTLSAFRGLVLAAKDPDQDVRVSVVKALERLQGSHSRDILEQLKDDPDSRIRKYTRWALERLDSLAME